MDQDQQRDTREEADNRALEQREMDAGEANAPTERFRDGAGNWHDIDPDDPHTDLTGGDIDAEPATEFARFVDGDGRVIEAPADVDAPAFGWNAATDEQPLVHGEPDRDAHDVPTTPPGEPYDGPSVHDTAALPTSTPARDRTGLSDRAAAVLVKARTLGGAFTWVDMRDILGPGDYPDRHPDGVDYHTKNAVRDELRNRQLIRRVAVAKVDGRTMIVWALAPVVHDVLTLMSDASIADHRAAFDTALIAGALEANAPAGDDAQGDEQPSAIAELITGVEQIADGLRRRHLDYPERLDAMVDTLDELTARARRRHADEVVAQLEQTRDAVVAGAAQAVADARPDPIATATDLMHVIGTLRGLAGKPRIHGTDRATIRRVVDLLVDGVYPRDRLVTADVTIRTDGIQSEVRFDGHVFPWALHADSRIGVHYLTGGIAVVTVPVLAHRAVLEHMLGAGEQPRTDMPGDPAVAVDLIAQGRVIRDAEQVARNADATGGE